MLKPTPGKPRRALPSFRVYCTEDEYTQIAAKAATAGLSASRYLRSLGTGCTVVSIADQDLALTMVRINADMGRLGGLLKAMLTNDERFRGYRGKELEQLAINTLRSINDQQAKLRRAVEGIVGR